MNSDRCTVIVKKQQIDTTFGLAAFSVFASDTCWERIEDVSDSLSKAYKKKAYIISSFSYPEKNIPAFNKNSFSIDTKGVDINKDFVFAIYYDTSETKAPTLLKLSEKFEEAKELEKKGEL